MARGIVLVTPGIFPAIKIVAPNSPNPRAKERIDPLRIPFHANDNEMVQNTRNSEAPNVRAIAVDGS